MGGYIPHHDIDDALQVFRATGPIWDTADFERQLIGLTYRALCWEFLHDVLPPHEMVALHDRVDELIRADAQQQEAI